MDKINSVQKSQVSWERIKSYLTEHKIKDNSSNINKGGVTLSVENLSFSYEEGKENIIEDISFEGKAGEIIGVTGSVASGKSTLGLSLYIQLTISGIKRVNNFYSETEDNFKKNELRVEDIIPNH